MIEQLLRPRECAEILSCSSSFIYKLIDQNKLPAVKIPSNGSGKQNQKHCVRIKPRDLELFVDSFHTGS